MDMDMSRFFTLETETKNLFYQVPKVFMLEESKYFKMSAMTKLLYGVLADRNSLSIKNGWVDEEKRVFFLFSQAEIGKLLGISPGTVIKYLKELESENLLYRIKQGLTRTDKLYLLQVEIPEIQSYQLISKNCVSGDAEIDEQGFQILTANNTNTNNTESIKKNRSGTYPIPPELPEEFINDLDKYVIGRFKKERQFYGINFNQDQYYVAFADAIVKTQLQDSVEIITMTQYPYFIATLKKMVEPLNQ